MARASSALAISSPSTSTVASFPFAFKRATTRIASSRDGPAMYRDESRRTTGFGTAGRSRTIARSRRATSARDGKAIHVTGPPVETSMDPTARRPLSPALFAGFAVASIGGPPAPAALYVPGAADMRSAGLLTPLRALRYSPPLLVWVRFSRDAVSPAGLAGFVEAAAGRRLALVQAAVWTVSYFLYLPYTVTDIVYEMLAVVFPGIEPWRPLLEVTIPIGIVALLLVGTLPALRVLAAS